MSRLSKIRRAKDTAIVLLLSALCTEGYTNCSGFSSAVAPGITNANLSVPGGSSIIPVPSATPVSATTPAAIAGKNYVMTFDDEFTSPTDITASSTSDGVAKWYNGTDQCCMSDTVGRGTAMYPTQVNGATTNPYQFISGGGVNINLQLTGNTWFSGVMTSVDKNGVGFSQKYGYFEMKAKFPGTPGSWPGFWMLNTSNLNGSSAATGGNGEIDILEQYGSFNTYCVTLHDWTNNTPQYWNNCTWPQTAGMPSVEFTQFHTYGMLWTETTMSFYMDDILIGTGTTGSMFKQPYYLLVDLGIGGGWDTSATPSMNTMSVQYVRAWQSQ